MHQVIVLGSGMGSLAAAVLLAKKGLKPLILEQNWIPGGCTTSYPRKGYIFEAGATTLVGLDDHMPLRYLLDSIHIDLNARKLDLPMQVHLKNGQRIDKHQNLDDWIKEAEKHFGGNQKHFWNRAYEVSQFVWKSSTKYLHFPPSKFSDFLQLGKRANPLDLLKARNAFRTTKSVVQSAGLNNESFESYINEQLLITAQNPQDQVNFLFGAAALCYTNYGNYYMDGGLANLAKPLVEYIKRKGGDIAYREGVINVTKKKKGGYVVKTKSRTLETKYLISGIPLNNLAAIASEIVPDHKKEKILPSEKLYSAFQMGIAFKSKKQFESIHHQIHLADGLPQINAKSIFVSLNHAEDTTRTPAPDIRIASVSTHIKNPEHNVFTDALVIENSIIEQLEKRGFLDRKDILYTHSSGPKSWNKWTGRAFGFVGGYPQYFKTKPWQMVEARIDHQGAYMCGDTAYPGQGIPGATLSGIIAAEKLITDWM